MSVCVYVHICVCMCVCEALRRTVVELVCRLSCDRSFTLSLSLLLLLHIPSGNVLLLWQYGHLCRVDARCALPQRRGRGDGRRAQHRRVRLRHLPSPHRRRRLEYVWDTAAIRRTAACVCVLEEGEWKRLCFCCERKKARGEKERSVGKKGKKKKETLEVAPSLKLDCTLVREAQGTILCTRTHIHIHTQTATATLAADLSNVKGAKEKKNEAIVTGCHSRHSPRPFPATAALRLTAPARHRRQRPCLYARRR